MLSPLMARGDAAGARTPRLRPCADAATSNGAKSAIEAAMPGSSSNMAYFFRKLPALRSDQKAAAVNLGIFPGSGRAGRIGCRLDDRSGRSAQSDGPERCSWTSDRIGSIERWLSQATQGTATVPNPPAAPHRAAAGRLRVRSGDRRSQRMTARPDRERKLWIQLASGPNADGSSRPVRPHEGAQPQAVRGHKRLYRRGARPRAPADRPVPQQRGSQYLRRRPCIGPH